MVDTRKIRRKKGGEEENVLKPSCVAEYNRGMGGVDRQDQFLASFPLMRKSIKGYKKMFFYMVDIPGVCISFFRFFGKKKHVIFKGN